MAVGQSQLEKVIYEIDRGADVSQLEDEYMSNMTDTQERITKEVRLTSESSSFGGELRTRHGSAGIGASTSEDDSDRRRVLLQDGGGQA